MSETPTLQLDCVPRLSKQVAIVLYCSKMPRCCSPELQSNASIRNRQPKHFLQATDDDTFSKKKHEKPEDDTGK